MVAIRKHFAPKVRVSKGRNKRKYITIHETANRGRGANANAHARLQAGVNSRQASWHYQVDDREVVQSFADTVRCWHAGTKANNESIAIEICVNSDGDYDKALANAAALVAHLRKKYNIPWNRVVSHKFWTGKNCPTIMLAEGRWDNFIAATNPKGATKIKTSSGTSSNSSKPSSGSKTVSQMATEVIAGKHGSGHANRQRSLGVNNSTYAKVRAEVNRRAGVSTTGNAKPAPKKSKTVSQMASEVIAGKHGSGHANRQRSLGVNNSTYAKVRAAVNKSAGVRKASPRKLSISQMATEVIQGKHGSGHANRQRSLGVSSAVYAKVRKEVNRRL